METLLKCREVQKRVQRDGGRSRKKFVGREIKEIIEKGTK